MIFVSFMSVLSVRRFCTRK